MKKAIRTQYADMGVENYYRVHGEVYENPHFEYIKQLLIQNEHRIDYSKTLDLACGGGEVTLILRGIGFDATIGCDPFTHQLFEKNTQKECLLWSFEDIIKGAIVNDSLVITSLTYRRKKTSVTIPFNSLSCVISSFAMHLCPEKQLYPLVTQLFRLTKNIVIITPHKRPELEKIANVTLLFEDFVLTERGKKVFLKNYVTSPFAP